MLEYSQQRQFIRAVEELENLVVQRLFELSKANLASTGEVVRRPKVGTKDKPPHGDSEGKGRSRTRLA